MRLFETEGRARPWVGALTLHAIETTAADNRAVGNGARKQCALPGGGSGAARQSRAKNIEGVRHA